MSKDEEQRWLDFNADYDERWELHQLFMGPLSQEVLMLDRLRVSCPGMCVVQSAQPQNGNRFMVSTFGLSGIHAGSGIAEQVEQEQVEGDKYSRVSKLVSAPTPPTNNGLAGFGLEFIAVSAPGSEAFIESILMAKILEEIVYQHLTAEFDYLKLVLEYGAVTSGPWPDGSGGEINFVISQPWGGLPTFGEIQNGKIYFLALTNINSRQLNISHTQGPPALLEPLMKKRKIPCIEVVPR